MAAYSGTSRSVRDAMGTIEKVRRLPLPGEVLVKVGDVVRPDTAVARIAVRPGIPWVIPVASHLGIPPEDMRQKLTKSVGDMVKPQEILGVVDRGLYGRKEYFSPVEGRVEEISDLTGRVTIREEFGKEEPPIVVNVAEEIKCRPSEVPQNMLRGVGQEVKKGQMIAKKGDIQAFFTRTAAAPISGVISEVNAETGKITISRPFKQVVVDAYISGIVSAVAPGVGCTVRTEGVRLHGIFGIGKETYGDVMVLTASHEDVLEADLVGAQCKGKVIVGGSFATNEALLKARAVGAKAVVTGTANYLNLTESLGVKLGVGITGQEDIDLSVILTEGFGRLAMRREVWETLKALEGHLASVNGATQIRAGAIRPEIIVPTPLSDGPVGDDNVIDEHVKVGMRVRIISEPFFGAVGVVTELPREPRVIETEARVPVIKIQIDNIGPVVIPRANVEAF